MGDIQPEAALRRLEPHWNYGLIAASIAVSLLGAFTSTQMMCQARTARFVSGILVWTVLGSLTFGFCSIWSLHFVAMLACELDTRIGLNVKLTVLSAFLAVSFTFIALASDFLRDRYWCVQRTKSARPAHDRRRDDQRTYHRHDRDSHGATEALLGTYAPDRSPGIASTRDTNESQRGRPNDGAARVEGGRAMSLGPLEEHFVGADSDVDLLSGVAGPRSPWPPSQSPSCALKHSILVRDDSMTQESSAGDSDCLPRSSSDEGPSSRSSTSDTSSGLGLPAFMSFKLHATRTSTTATTATSTATNALTRIAELVYHGATVQNFAKGVVWSLAITSMHYVGIAAMEIPQGHFTLRPWIVLLSALISWLVCSLGCILMPQIEVNLTQQLLFSVIAALGVAAMHFTGMLATTFWSRAAPAAAPGYPPNLAVAVTSIAILTCMLANGLLAHSATVARNKLAEIVQTRKKLWAAIAQKEHAEAAAMARSEFIASASHEIRTPLHQLQGYGDLLSRTHLSDDARLLLLAIQQATRSLSMITANVLDWSRLEKGEAVCRPSSLDLRQVCESLVNILPLTDDVVGMELMIVVAPDVPQELFLDETYLQRILMNLLTNAMKFTQSGYVLLMVHLAEKELVVTVQDSGYGIPAAFLPHLFEPFKQAQTRGAERGTGLGLAITKQLLEKINATIAVESKCQQTDGVGWESCGSTFTVRIPVTVTPDAPATAPALGIGRCVAVIQDHDSRIVEGLHMAWAAYGLDVVAAGPTDEISASWALIWIDEMVLRARPTLLRRLARHPQLLVLVSYDSQLFLDKAIGSVPPAHIIPIKRPFLWHRIVDHVVSALQSGKSSVDRTVRFAPLVDVVDHDEELTVREKRALGGATILLVEDNRINQRLGAKMCKTLGYNVIIADDGQEALDRVVEYHGDIDIILMDQSMPRKDGIAATKEIRELEKAGALSRKRIPICMVTAVVGPDAQAQCMAAGADAFLAKPLALAKLEHTLKKFLV